MDKLMKKAGVIIGCVLIVISSLTLISFMITGKFDSSFDFYGTWELISTSGDNVLDFEQVDVEGTIFFNFLKDHTLQINDGKNNEWFIYSILSDEKIQFVTRSGVSYVFYYRFENHNHELNIYQDDSNIKLNRFGGN